MTEEYKDPYNRRLIMSYVKLPVQVIAGSFVRGLLSLGDRFAVSCSMCIDEERLCDPQMVQRIVSAIEFIFYGRGEAECPSDSYPVFSEFFLRRMLALCVHEVHQESRVRIESTLERLHGWFPECFEATAATDEQE